MELFYLGNKSWCHLVFVSVIYNFWLWSEKYAKWLILSPIAIIFASVLINTLFECLNMTAVVFLCHMTTINEILENVLKKSSQSAHYTLTTRGTASTCGTSSRLGVQVLYRYKFFGCTVKVTALKPQISSLIWIMTLWREK